MADISIIIPTYNVENFIEESLDSIKNQTFSGEIEIILIDDCSTDRTREVITNYKHAHPDLQIHVLHQERNMKQGTARNRGLDIAEGEYIIFLDADDFLNAHFLEKMYTKAQATSCDMVVCDWSYYYADRGFVHKNNDGFMSTEFLSAMECERLLEAKTYFTVNKLYKRSFLLSKGIRYGEGYIYEDYEFYMETAIKANSVFIIPEPLYYVRINEQSTTKSNRKTMLHIESLVKAVEHTVDKFQPRKKESYFYLYKYLVKKTMNYLHHRAPAKQKKQTLKRILLILNEKNTDYHVPKGLSPLFHLYFYKKYVQQQKILSIIFVDWLHRNGYLKPIFSKVVKMKSLLKNSRG